MQYLTVKQRKDLTKIANGYPNLQCIQCASAIKNYLLLAGIKGKLIKINSRFRLS